MINNSFLFSKVQQNISPKYCPLLFSKLSIHRFRERDKSIFLINYKDCENTFHKKLMFSLAASNFLSTAAVKPYFNEFFHAAAFLKALFSYYVLLSTMLFSE